MAEPEAAELYSFEEGARDLRLPPARRGVDAAGQALATLRVRLGIPQDVALEKDFEKALMRYCTDTILNILWYDLARKREQRANTQRTWLMIALMAAALILLCVSPFIDGARAKPTSEGLLPLALLAGGALTVLQVVAALGDGKARLAIFWKAGADLKEALYNFEHKWHGRVFQGNPLCVAEAFDAALQDELRAARAVTRAERLEFFANMRSPSDVLAVAVGAVNSIRTRRVEDTQLGAARDERVATARRSASEARAAVLASEFRLKNLADPAERSAEEAALVKARAEVVRTEAIMQDIAG
jgi:hypothetical protein